MKKYVVSYADQSSWKTWTTYWLSSLNKFANFDGEVLLFFRGDLPSKPVLDKLSTKNIHVLAAANNYSDRHCDLLASLGKIVSTHEDDAVFIYWGIDSYFESDINELFDRDNMVYCDGGMIGGPGRLWEIFYNFGRFLGLENTTVHDLCQQFQNHFPAFAEKQELVWNCDLPSAVKEIEGKLHIKKEVVKVFCPSDYQSLSAVNGLLFNQRHSAVIREWEKWLYGKPSYKKVLFNVTKVMEARFDGHPSDVDQ
jgi:hypothetical protein